jgi:hypothetical protein
MIITSLLITVVLSSLLPHLTTCILTSSGYIYYIMLYTVRKALKAAYAVINKPVNGQK